MPKSWVTQNKVKKGDELEITEQGSKLIISSDSAQEVLSTVIDVTGLDRTSILFYIRSAYRRGYDVIDIRYSEPHTKHLRTGAKKKISSVVHEEVSRLVGVEVIQQKEDSCMIKSISQTTSDDFQNILRRIFILLTDFADDISNGYKEANTGLLESAEEKHDNITKFISYSLRLLNKTNDYSPSERTMMYHAVASLENIVDALKWGGRRGHQSKNKRFNKKTLEIVEMIMKSIGMYYDFFYKFDSRKVGVLYKHRHDIREDIEKIIGTLPIGEAIIINELSRILETIVSLTEIKMGMEQSR
ncbi:TPA: AbrB/MazE/SpoVT family DNA-binding domain-containing protein [Candidatus Woesearchaeota archaeon]|nr:AbrB/MazE/SpoVT family DNA-binding domain-containing protein [Candidatus Woesearchaeota archaeon]